FNSIEKDTVWNKTLDKIRSQGYADQFVPEKPLFPWYRIVGVASLLIVISFFAYRTFKVPSTTQFVESSIQEEKDILPGGNKAILNLSDGTTVSLDEVDRGEIMEVEGMKISKKSDVQVVYDAVTVGSQPLTE